MKPRDFLNKYLLPDSMRLTKGTTREELNRFLQSVYPVVTEHALIRLGGDADGGYLIPDDLLGIQTCFSPGVSVTADFEEDLAKRGIRSFMADYSVAAPPLNNPLFHFEKKFLGSRNDAIFTTLQSWVDRNAPDENDMILQMDIEGGEYAVLFCTSSETLRRFRILVIEFHNLNELVEKRGHQLIGLTFEKILNDFDLVHAHPNNCADFVRYKGFDLPPVMEFTFLRKDRSTSRAPAVTFPHPLDRRNVRRSLDQPLPHCWRSR